MRNKLVCTLILIAVFSQGCATNKNTLSDEEARAKYEEQLRIIQERMRTATVTQNKNKDGGTVTNYHFAGSLKPNASLDCVPASQVTNKINPPALVYAAKKCMKQNEYKKAWELLSLGSGFAYYDLKRLADRSTGGAWTVLNMNAFSDLTKEQRDKYKKTSSGILASPSAVKAHCKLVKKIGSPTYEPNWAIKHGIGSYQEPRNGHYLANVNPDDIWNEVLKKRCNSAKSKK